MAHLKLYCWMTMLVLLLVTAMPTFASGSAPGSTLLVEGGLLIAPRTDGTTVVWMTPGSSTLQAGIYGAHLNDRRPFVVAAANGKFQLKPAIAHETVVWLEAPTSCANCAYTIFAKDLRNGQVVTIGTANGGLEPDFSGRFPDVEIDDHYIVWSSFNPDGTYQLYLRDTDTMRDPMILASRGPASGVTVKISGNRVAWEESVVVPGQKDIRTRLMVETIGTSMPTVVTDAYGLNGTPYEVLLGRLGDEALRVQGRDWTTFPKADPQAAHYAPATGHAIASQFWDYYRSHGLELGDTGVTEREALALFGYPLSEPLMERNSSGDTVLTQYFERARFEYHPSNADPYKVLLGRLGSDILAQRGW